MIVLGGRGKAIADVEEGAGKREGGGKGKARKKKERTKVTQGVTLDRKKARKEKGGGAEENL